LTGVQLTWLPFADISAGHTKSATANYYAIITENYTTQTEELNPNEFQVFHAKSVFARRV